MLLKDKKRKLQKVTDIFKVSKRVELPIQEQLQKDYFLSTLSFASVVALFVASVVSSETVFTESLAS